MSLKSIQLKFVSFYLLLGLVLSFSAYAENSAANIAGANSCKCPEVTCDNQCEVQQESVDFYTEKCSGNRVRSCMKKTCVKIEPYPKVCVNKLKQAAVGHVEALSGRAWKVQNSRVKKALKVGSYVNEKDVLEVGGASRLEIGFKDGNQIVLSANTYVELSKVMVNTPEDKRQTLLKLLKGKIRSKVGQHKKLSSVRKPASILDTKDYKFVVKTPTAVAGVRGTDFVVAYDYNKAADMAKTEVSTFNGLVDLSGAKDSKIASIGVNEKSAHVVKGASVAKDKQQTYLMSVQKMTESESEGLKDEMVLASTLYGSQKLSPVMNIVCRAPAAGLNQCSWECVNNPKGQKTCRTDLPNVRCVRKACKANGEWQELSRLPASYGDYCDSRAPRVGPCDY